MRIYKSTENVNFLKNGVLFFDNNALVAIINNEVDFAPFLKTVVDYQCTLMTIPSVGFEFSRTDSIENYSKRNEFLKEYLTVYPVERHVEIQIVKFKDFIFVLHNTARYAFDKALVKFAGNGGFYGECNKKAYRDSDSRHLGYRERLSE